MKLAVIVPILNQHDLADTAIDFIDALSGPDVEIIALDNGSNPPYKRTFAPGTRPVKTVTLPHNIGVYPTFWEGLNHTDADILAFFHSDLLLSEKGWDVRVLSAFQNKPQLGLLGFIGSNQIDASGGRGLGTTSNFQGNECIRQKHDGTQLKWKGSPAEVHGKRYHGLTHAAVVDGCSMIFRREVLEKIKQRDNFPPHHFYDRLLSCETREAGYDVGVLGIACDHISGQTVNQEDAYHQMARYWMLKHWTAEVPSMADNINWDEMIYKEAERQWLSEYRDQKHFIPCKV